jgi:hypothetical protein
VSLGGVYSGSGLSAATSASLAPHSALVLTRDGQAPVGPPTPPTPTPTPTPSAPAPAVSPSPAATVNPSPTPTPRPAKPRRPRAHSVRRVLVSVRCVGGSAGCRGSLVLKGRRSASGKDLRVRRNIHVRPGRRVALALRVPAPAPDSWRVAVRMRSGHLKLLTVR